MTDEQENDWAYKMVSCLGLSTANSDINVIKLHMNIKKLYEQGCTDEREACAKLCEETTNLGWFAKEIRARGEK